MKVRKRKAFCENCGEPIIEDHPALIWKKEVCQKCFSRLRLLTKKSGFYKEQYIKEGFPLKVLPQQN